jgi:GxxExxY protein
MEVHSALGCTFGEAVCGEALGVELQLRKIPFRTQVPFPIFYKEIKLPAFYRADFVCYDNIVVELKSMKVKSGTIEEAQMLRYLRASGMSLGLLFNFGLPRLEYRRFIISPAQFWSAPKAVLDIRDP